MVLFKNSFTKPLPLSIKKNRIPKTYRKEIGSSTVLRKPSGKLFAPDNENSIIDQAP